VNEGHTYQRPEIETITGCSLINDDAIISELPKQEDALTFEGKEFHYLDSLSILLENDDGIENFLEASSDDFVTGLTFGMDGKLCGFDS
jgi:hypothetical protein